jgi:hypothetical protein
MPELQADDSEAGRHQASQQVGPEAEQGGAVPGVAPSPGAVTLTPEQQNELVKKVQASLLRQAKRNRHTGIALPGTKPSPPPSCPPQTIADLIKILQTFPQDLLPLITNGDLPNTEINSISIGPADFGQAVILSR